MRSVGPDDLVLLLDLLITVDAIQRRGLSVAAVVLNEVTPHRTSLADWNLEDLKRHLSMPVIPFPYQPKSDLATAGKALLTVLQN